MISGFATGDYVVVECEGDKITFKESLEERINKLDPKKRKKLAELIDSL